MSERGFPAEFLRWLDAPIADAFESLNKVRPSPRTNREWAEVNRALRTLRQTREELSRLAEWIRASGLKEPLDLPRQPSQRIRTPHKLYPRGKSKGGE